jgi:hypothetical protein
VEEKPLKSASKQKATTPKKDATKDAKKEATPKKSKDFTDENKCVKDYKSNSFSIFPKENLMVPF